MQLSYIELRDIKSYENSGRIEFAHGINAISGQNGAGKSTLLEAIGFALFDSHPHTAKNFIREGSKNGEVIVGFIDALDSRVYEVVRSVTGSQGNPYIYDPQIKKKIVAGKDDVYTWIKEHLRVSQAGDLESIFEDAVGVQQGLLTASFQMRPSDRKPKFDRLLQVDEYEGVYKWLGETEKRLKELVSDERVNFERLTTRLEELPVQQAKAASLSKEIAALQFQLGEITAELERVRGQKSILDTLKEKITKLETECQLAVQKHSGLETQMASADSERQAAARAKELVDASEADYLAYQECEKELPQLDTERKRRDALVTLVNKGKVDLSALETSQTQANINLKAVEEAEAALKLLEPILAEYREVLHQLEEARAAQIQRDNALRQIDSESTRLTEMDIELNKVQADLLTRAELEVQVANFNGAFSALSEEMGQNKASVVEMRGRIDQASERLGFLIKSEAGECPVCHSELTPGHKHDLEEQYRAEIRNLEQKIHEWEARQKAITEAQKDLNKKIRALQQQLEKLPAPSRALELTEQIQTQKDKVQEMKGQMTQFAGLDDRFHDLRAQKETFDDPEGKVAVQKDAADKRKQVEKALHEVESSLSKLKTKQVADQQELDAFAGLDERITANRQEMERLKAGHSQYISNQQAASQLPARKKRVVELTTQRDSAAQEVEALNRQLDETKPTYDAKKHEQISQRFNDLNRDQAAAGSQVQSLQGQLKTAKEKVAELEPLVAKRAASQKELDTLKIMQDTLTFIRNTVREAGPYIVKQLLQSISEEADRIFGEILNDYTARLTWTQDYEIQLEQLGHSREFSQLSGGEKMAAALAVRLALLRQMSEIRLAFFDEPTAHLDTERRVNLAEQITKIKGFEQLFVISHDDTFEDQTDLVLHVTKENGISQIQKKGAYATS